MSQKLTPAGTPPTGPGREGEIALPFDPAGLEPQAALVFIGRLRTPWSHKDDCPKNMARANERGLPAYLELDPPYRAGLDGLKPPTMILVLSWLDRSRRDLVVQRPRHADSARGVFALRSPVRPNPIGLHLVRLKDIDATAGLLTLEAIDALDGTPVIDLKPYYASVDSPPQQTDVDP